MRVPPAREYLYPQATYQAGPRSTPHFPECWPRAVPLGPSFLLASPEEGKPDPSFVLMNLREAPGATPGPYLALWPHGALPQTGAIAPSPPEGRQSSRQPLPLGHRAPPTPAPHHQLLHSGPIARLLPGEGNGAQTAAGAGADRPPDAHAVSSSFSVLPSLGPGFPDGAQPVHPALLGPVCGSGAEPWPWTEVGAPESSGATYPFPSRQDRPCLGVSP